MKQNRHNIRVRSLWLAGAASASAMLLAAAPAAAQDEEDSSVITVTAQWREENIQEVPLSVATLPAAQLSTIFDSGDDVTALAARVPGLYVESSNGRAAPRFYIRGLGNTDFDLAASQPVSVIMDDVVLENVTLKSSPIFDVERVEVLRGPQGSLFGRNTPAGIVKFTTVKPSDAFDLRTSTTGGSFGTATFDGGVGGAIVPGVLAARFSALYQRRSDWIDNGFTGEKNALGGYEEVAVRGQMLVTSGAFSALGNVHYRNLDGTAAIFRANILGPGNNKVNANFDRDTVYFDGGANNPQSYRGWGSSLTIDYDFGGAALTSISAYESSKGHSRGDIDGGNMVTGPGFIPFPSDTQDSIDLDQYTQEVRLASTGGGPFSWQVGAFYFNSDFTVLTEGFTFPPPTLVRHENESWAVFGQGSVEVSELFKVTGGLRYTKDSKDFTVIGGSPANDRHVSDDRVSWDLSLMYYASDAINLYVRAASGFRAPTIQGRDVAFFSPPSVATSEKILSAEGGFKGLFDGGRVRINGAVFAYRVDDPQFTAVGGGCGNCIQLLNAQRGEAWGFELDSEFRATEELIFTFGLSYNNTRIKDPALAVGICAQCTVTDPIVTLGGTPRALIDGNPFPNAPTWIADVTARYAVPLGNGGEFFVFTDWAYQGETNLFLYESREFNTDNQFEGGLRIGYASSDGSYELAVFARNITNEVNVKGGIDFNNNTAFVNEPRTFGVSFRARVN